MGEILENAVSPRALHYDAERDEWCVDAAYDAVLANLFTDYESLRARALRREARRAATRARRRQWRARRPVRLGGIALLLLVGLLLLGQGLRGLRLDPPAAADPQPETLHTAPMRVPARLIAVIDGDTIDVEIEGARRRIRYLGMDTPERGEPLYAEATRRNRELLAAGTLLLERDQSETDRYGRLLRWVLLEDGTLVNEVLVREGLARAQIWDPDVRYAEAIKSAEQEARANQVGLWITAGQ